MISIPHGLASWVDGAGGEWGGVGPLREGSWLACLNVSSAFSYSFASIP